MNAPPSPPPSPADQHPLAQPAPLATSLALLLPLGVVIAFLLLVVGTATAVGRWLLLDEAGSQWLVQRLPLVEVQGFRGTLLGPSWQADRIEARWDKDRQSLTIEGLSAQGLQWTWQPHDQAWVGLSLQSLQARKVTVITGPGGEGPQTAPSSLALPLDLQVQATRIDELQIDGVQTVRELALDGLSLDARTGAAHQVQQARGVWQGLFLQLGGRIDTAAPQRLTLQATLRPQAVGGVEADSPPWAAVLQVTGTLVQPELTATLRGVPRKGQEPPALDVRAQLQPLQAWPLKTLSVLTQGLDLAALSAALPQTRLSGQVTLDPMAARAPLTATVDLRNTLPGRWNEGRLPVAQLQGRLQGDLAQPDRLALTQFEMLLADAGGRAGRLSGSAVWQGPELQLDTQLHDLAPQRLDGRAAAMVLSGPVKATVRGLPSPTGDVPAPGTSPQVRWQLDLEGRLDASPVPVRLAMEGSASDDRLEVTRLRAAAGPASAELRGLLQRQGKAGWTLESTGSLVDFDPLPWWPGTVGSAWRQGPHRLSAGWEADLRLPSQAATLPALELLQRLAGNGSLRLHDSVLAGVPVSASIKLGYTQAAAPTTVLLRADLVAGGNEITIDGRGDPTSNGQGDRWRVDLKADALATLAPLTRLHPALADWVPRQGTATARLAADGRWPELRSEGSARISQLQVGPLTLAQGQADWRMDTVGDRPLTAKLALSGLVWGGQRADHLNAVVNGTLAAHRIEVSGALPLRPPALAAELLAVQAQSGTRVQMAAQGGWRPDPAGGGRWKARVERLAVGSWDGSPGDAPPASLWLQARDLNAELGFEAGGRWVSLQADPGRLSLASDVALRWDDIRVDLRGEQAQIELRADIEPFALAPLLARLYPAMGWSGDMRLAAKVDIRAAERFDADLVFERRDGDLHLAGSEGTQLLGLTDVRVQLSAHDGVWLFNPMFKSRSLGVITGSARVQTTADRRWPSADATLQGELQARVADIGIWSAWVPPGWRLAGEVRTVAALSGRFGAPRYTGEVTGSGLSVRNLLQGVNVSDGQVKVRLDGDTATIERFTMRGGEGTLDLTGGGSLGDAPQARLQLTADRFRAIGRVDRMVTASGDAELVFSRESGRLNGRLKLDEGLFDFSRSDAPTLDSDVTVRRPGEPEPAATEARQAGPRRNFSVALDLDLGEQLRIKGRGLDTRLKGSLRIANPGGRVDVRGTINAVEGTYAAYGQKLALERGIVAFGGPFDDPRLDVLALRPNIDTRVGVSITGTAQTPRVRLFSDPDMSDTEKLSWLVLGRAPDGLGRTDTALLQRAAVALLAGEGEAPTDALMRNLGIDEISLKQGDGDVRETVISLGKQLSRRWYVGYEQGVNSTTGTWQLIYRIAQQFTLRAQSGLENSLDVIWTWRFQETPPDASMRKSTVKPP